MKHHCCHAATVALLILGSTALPAQSWIAYAPTTHRYHMISVITRVQGTGQQKAEFKVTNEQQVSVKITTHGKDTLDFDYTLDSSRINTNPPVQLPDLSKMQGTTVHGSMSPLGKVYAYQSRPPADSNEDVHNLVDGMSKFLLPLPAHATVGSVWTDTTLDTVRRDGNNLDMTTVTTSKILGDTTFDGQHAWRLQRTSVLLLQGNQNQAGQQLSIEGNGTASGMYYLSTSGIYLGGSSTQNMQMKLTVPATGETVPVIQTATSTVELMPNR